MNDPVPNDLEKYANRAIEPIIASPGRKRRMLEELLGHLLSAYDEERSSLQNDGAAAEAAWQRLGDPQILSAQLQASVPAIERLLFMCLGRKETPMSRLLSVLGVLALITLAVIGINLMLPLYGPLILLTATASAAAWGLLNLCRRDSAVARSLGPHGVWLLGAFGVFFGMAVILPALAKMKQGGAQAPHFIGLALGLVIVLEGFGIIVCGVMRRHTPAT
ncbi:MAG TPA: hypothetical protein VH518_09450 [Tepidisphaeraceae bacterium]|jgi:hypothetical protein